MSASWSRECECCLLKVRIEGKLTVIRPRVVVPRNLVKVSADGMFAIVVLVIREVFLVYSVRSSRCLWYAPLMVSKQQGRCFLRNRLEVNAALLCSAGCWLLAITVWGLTSPTSAGWYELPHASCGFLTIQ